MATVTPVLRASKKDKRGHCPIWLRISDRDCTQFVSLGVKVLPSQWNKRQGRVRRGHPNADLINKLISKKLVEAETEILRLKIEDTYATASEIKKVITHEGDVDFFAFADRHVQDLEKRGNIGRQRRLKATLGKLRVFAGEPLYFDRITVRLLRDFETHCLVKLCNKQSTVATNLSDLRAIINKAVAEGLIEHGVNPFLRFTITQGETPERTKLTPQEVQTIEALDLEEGSLTWHVRNYFLFAFYAAGIRFSDLAMMTQGRILEGDDGIPDRLIYRMGKTGKRQSIKVTPPARRILAQYLTENADPEAFVFPMLDGYDLSTPRKLHNARSSRNTLVNKYLKQIAAQAGIDKPLSTHIARHSFADLARSSGWSIYDISKALRHSSVEMTERYLKAFDSAALDSRMDALFGETQNK